MAATTTATSATATPFVHCTRAVPDLVLVDVSVLHASARACSQFHVTKNHKRTHALCEFTARTHARACVQAMIEDMRTR